MLKVHLHFLLLSILCSRIADAAVATAVVTGGCDTAFTDEANSFVSTGDDESSTASVGTVSKPVKPAKKPKLTKEQAKVVEAKRKNEERRRQLFRTFLARHFGAHLSMSPEKRAFAKNPPPEKFEILYKELGRLMSEDGTLPESKVGLIRGVFERVYFGTTSSAQIAEIYAAIFRHAEDKELKALMLQFDVLLEAVAKDPADIDLEQFLKAISLAHSSQINKILEKTYELKIFEDPRIPALIPHMFTKYEVVPTGVWMGLIMAIPTLRQQMVQPLLTMLADKKRKMESYALAYLSLLFEDPNNQEYLTKFREHLPDLLHHRPLPTYSWLARKVTIPESVIAAMVAGYDSYDENLKNFTWWTLYQQPAAVRARYVDLALKHMDDDSERISHSALFFLQRGEEKYLTPEVMARIAKADLMLKNHLVARRMGETVTIQALAKVVASHEEIPETIDPVQKGFAQRESFPTDPIELTETEQQQLLRLLNSTQISTYSKIMIVFFLSLDKNTTSAVKLTVFRWRQQLVRENPAAIGLLGTVSLRSYFDFILAELGHTGCCSDVYEELFTELGHYTADLEVLYALIKFLEKVPVREQIGLAHRIYEFLNKHQLINIVEADLLQEEPTAERYALAAILAVKQTKAKQGVIELAKRGAAQENFLCVALGIKKPNVAAGTTSAVITQRVQNAAPAANNQPETKDPGAKPADPVKQLESLNPAALLEETAHSNPLTAARAVEILVERVQANEVKTLRALEANGFSFLIERSKANVESRASIRSKIYDLVIAYLEAKNFELNDQQFNQAQTIVIQVLNGQSHWRNENLNMLCRWILNAKNPDQAQTIYKLLALQLDVKPDHLPGKAEIVTFAEAYRLFSTTDDASIKATLASILHRTQGFQIDTIKEALSGATSDERLPVWLQELCAERLVLNPRYVLHKVQGLHRVPEYSYKLGDFQDHRILPLELNATFNRALIKTDEDLSDDRAGQILGRVMEESSLASAMAYEMEQGRLPIDVSGDTKKGFDIWSVDLRTAKVRRIEAKAKLIGAKKVLISKHEAEVAEETLNVADTDYYLYVVYLSRELGRTPSQVSISKFKSPSAESLKLAFIGENPNNSNSDWYSIEALAPLKTEE